MRIRFLKHSPKNFLLLKTLFLPIFGLLFLVLSGCKEKVGADPYNSPDYYLQIENGAQTASMGNQIHWTVRLIGPTGQAEIPKPVFVQWSVNPSSLGVFSENVLKIGKTVGTGTVSVAVKLYGKTYTTSVPLNVCPQNQVFPFSVFPSSLFRFKGAKAVQLFPQIFANTNPVFTFMSSNETVAQVSSSGLISFADTGQAIIKVSAHLLNSDYTYNVPIMVASIPPGFVQHGRLSLPDGLMLFPNESVIASLTGIDEQGRNTGINQNQVSWRITAFDSLANFFLDANKKNQYTTILTVDSVGDLKAQRPGRVYLYAASSGLVAQTEVLVQYDTVSTLSPDYLEFDQNPVTAPTIYWNFYSIDRKAFRNGFGNYLKPAQGISTGEFSPSITLDSVLNAKLSIFSIKHGDPTGVSLQPNPGRSGDSFGVLQAHGHYVKNSIARINVLP